VFHRGFPHFTSSRDFQGATVFALNLGALNDRIGTNENMAVYIEPPQATVCNELVNPTARDIEQLASERDGEQVSLRFRDSGNLLNAYLASYLGPSGTKDKQQLKLTGMVAARGWWYPFALVSLVNPRPLLKAPLDTKHCCG